MNDKLTYKDYLELFEKTKEKHKNDITMFEKDIENVSYFFSTAFPQAKFFGFAFLSLYSDNICLDQTLCIQCVLKDECTGVCGLAINFFLNIFLSYMTNDGWIRVEPMFLC